jgi:hypothetical protein
MSEVPAVQVCKCVECSEKSKVKLDELIKAVNTVNTLPMSSGRKLDMIYVLCNEINAINNLIVQMRQNMAIFDAKLSEMESGELPSSLKACVEQSLADLKTNTPSEYDVFHKTVAELWDGKFQSPETKVDVDVKPEEVK